MNVSKPGGIKRPIIVAMVLAPLVAFSLTTVHILNSTADHIVAGQAERTALAWANYIGSRLDRIEAIASGSKITDEERDFLDGIRRFGDVFRFQLFSANAQLRLISDDLDNDVASAVNVGEHNKKAASVLATGVPHTEVKSGVDKPNRPDLYVESYVPVVHDGAVRNMMGMSLPWIRRICLQASIPSMDCMDISRIKAFGVQLCSSFKTSAPPFATRTV